MNAESFADYLAQPAKLYQLSYQEIKNLVAEYPFSANLRYLLLLKAKIEQDPKFGRYLHQYAAHAPDRPFLYQLLHEKLPELLDLELEQEEKLELLDLGTFQEKEAILLDQEEETTPAPNLRVAESAVTPTSPVSATSKEDESVELSAAPVRPSGSTLETTPARSTVNKEKTDSTESPAASAAIPLPKTAFDFWQNERPRATARERFARLRGQNLRERTTGSTAQVRKAAKESIARQEDLASETLAILLERQGQHEQAINMYERLSLLNPEKSRYFAAAIEKMKQKA